MLPTPEKPYVVGDETHNSLAIAWEVQGKTTSITHYTVSYKIAYKDEKSWKTSTTGSDVPALLINNLQPNTEYQFRVASNNKEKQSPFGSISDVIRTKKAFQNYTNGPTPQPPRLAGAPTHYSVPLFWDVTEDTSDVTHYTLTYEAVDQDASLDLKSAGELKYHDTKNADCSCIVEGLEPQTSYCFSVSSNTRKGRSPPSPKSKIISTTSDARVATPTGTQSQYDNPRTNTNLSRAMEKPRVPEKPVRMSTEFSGPISFLPQTSSEHANVSSTECLQAVLDQMPPIPGKPIISSNPFLNTSDNCVSLTWKVDGNTENVTHYTITHREAGSNGQPVIYKTETAQTYCTIPGLNPHTSYQFSVASNTKQGQSPFSELSEIISTSTQTRSEQGQIPPRPQKLSLGGSVGNDCVPRVWPVPGDTSPVTHHTPTHKEVGKGAWMMQPSERSDLINANEQPNIQPLDNLCPPKPNKPKAVNICNGILLTWTVPGNTTYVTHYTISYSRTGAKGWITLETEDSECHYALTDLDPNTSYRFRIASNTNQGQSPPSHPIDAIYTSKTSKPTPLAKPVKLECMSPPTHNSMTLVWQVEGDTSADITFTIAYKAIDEENSDSYEGLLTEVTTPKTWYTIQNLEPNTAYNISIAANTNDGQRHFSESSRTFKTALSQDYLRPKSKPKRAPLIPPPGAPRLAPGQKPTRYTIPIVWDADTERCGITHFTLAYKASTCKDWKEVRTSGSRCEYTLKDLKEGTDYTIRVQAHSRTASSSQSKDGVPIATEIRSAGQISREELQKMSQLIKSDKSMPLYQVPLKKTKDDERIQMFDLGVRPHLRKQEKVILAVGATGAGKSTLINGLLNNVIGVEWEEKSRFRLVQEDATSAQQSKSQTQSITIYTLHHQDTYSIPYTIRVIDTPGFGDTGGIGKDKLITDSIRNLFSNKDYGIDHIDAIGFVAQSSLARLTPTQKYIFDSILSLFGKDIRDNIFLLLTFSDSQVPSVLAAIEEAKLPFKSYFKFNNSALFANNDTGDYEHDEFDHMFWEMGTRSFQKFLTELGNVEGKSLYLTKEVLEERQQLETYVTGIQQDIRDGLTKLEQLRVEMEVVKQHEADIEKNKDFEYTVDEHQIKKINRQPGEHVTNCLTCNRTCHFPCRIPKDEDKDRCAAMDNTGNCTVCVEHCIWKLHHNVPFRFETEVVQVKKTSEELKARYEAAKGEKMNAEKLTNQIREDFNNLEMKVLHMTNEVRRSLERLSEIALRPNPLTALEYLDILIKSERAEAKPGFQARIDQLERVKEQARVLSEVRNKKYDPFVEFRDALASGKTPDQRASLKAVKANVSKKSSSSPAVKEQKSFLKKLKDKFKH